MTTSQTQKTFVSIALEWRMRFGNMSRNVVMVEAATDSRIMTERRLAPYGQVKRVQHLGGKMRR